LSKKIQLPRPEDQVVANSVPRTFSRRQFLRLAGVTTAGSVLGACSPARLRPAPRDGGPVQLLYQDWRTEWFPRMAQQMLDEFHAKHPSIRVFYSADPEDFEERMVADFQAGTAPDVFQGCCTHFPTWAQEGYTLDLRPYVKADLDQSTIQDWDPAQYQALFTRDGQQFGLPKYHGALALYYNKDLFDTYGVDYPDESWDHGDYLAAMKRLTHHQDGDGQTDVWGSILDVSWDRIQVHVNGWDGHLVDPDDPTRCRLGTPEALAAMDWLRARMWDDKVMATRPHVFNLTLPQAFVDGRVAMLEDGSWALKDILAGANFRVGVAPFPAGPARRVTLATTDGFGIYAGTRHPEAAWELVKFLISKEYGRAMARANFLQPARASLVEEWADFIRQEFPRKAREMNIAAFADGQLEGYSVTAEIFADMASAQPPIYEAWDKVFVLGHAGVDRLQAVCREIEEVQG
jgi:multiple sugar transport system substrate-binding protein